MSSLLIFICPMSHGTMKYTKYTLKAHVCYFVLMVGLLHYLYSLHADFYTLKTGFLRKIFWRFIEVKRIIPCIDNRPQCTQTLKCLFYFSDINWSWKNTNDNHLSTLEFCKLSSSSDVDCKEQWPHCHSHWLVVPHNVGCAGRVKFPTSRYGTEMCASY
jgi:hypothetical protein